MKRLVIFLLAIMPMAFCLSTAEAKPNKQTVVLYVDLHCQDCCNKILKNIPYDRELKGGVKDIVFDLEAKTATVTYDANKTDVPTIQKRLLRLVNLQPLRLLSVITNVMVITIIPKVNTIIIKRVF